MTLIDDRATAAAADARQAECLRSSLSEERAALVAEIAKRRNDIARRNQRGRTTVTVRLRADLNRVEAQLRYVEELIGRLDRRFATHSQTPGPTNADQYAKGRPQPPRSGG